MQPSDCPKFKNCSAPVCPLDSGSLNTTILPGEAVCYYQRLAAKSDVSVLPTDTTILEIARSTLEQYKQRYGILKNRLNRASKTKQKVFNIKRV